MSDFSVPWRGQLQFDSTGDYLMSTGQDLSEQRVVRGLMTNSEEADPDGNVILPADDPFNPGWGQSLGRLVGQNNTPRLKQSAAAKLHSGLVIEPTVDQATAPAITFVDSGNDTLFMVAQYQTIEGSVARVAAQLT